MLLKFCVSTFKVILLGVGVAVEISAPAAYLNVWPVAVNVNSFGLVPFRACLDLVILNTFCIVWPSTIIDTVHLPLIFALGIELNVIVFFELSIVVTIPSSDTLDKVKLVTTSEPL